MIKVETVGMLDRSVNNPVIVAEKDTKNRSFLTYDNILYFIDNTVVGDDAYRENVVIPAGEYLNGYQVKAWEGQKLVIDGKHVTGGIDDLVVGDVLVVQEDGALAKGTASGVHFVVSDVGQFLTEPAIKAVVTVASTSAGTGN